MKGTKVLTLNASLRNIIEKRMTSTNSCFSSSVLVTPDSAMHHYVALDYEMNFVGMAIASTLQCSECSSCF